MVFKEIVQGGELIKEHKIINILQNHLNLAQNPKEYPTMLILTCDITQTNDLFVYVKQRIEKTYQGIKEFLSKKHKSIV